MNVDVVTRLLEKPLVELTVAEAVYLALAADDESLDSLEDQVVALVEEQS